MGELNPVLGEDGHIDFYDKDNGNIVLVMPAPYLEDSNRERGEVTVLMEGSGSKYVLLYLVSKEWLTQVVTPSTTYSFAYGPFALRSSVTVGSRTLAEYSYTEQDHALLALDYGNGDGVQYTYDTLGRVTQERYEDGDTVSYRYDNSGALATVTDSATGQTTAYYYDFTDRLMKYVESGGSHAHTVEYEYDQINNLSQMVQTILGAKARTSYVYDDDNRVERVINDGAGRFYTYDPFSRISVRDTKFVTYGSTDGNSVYTDTFTYKTVNGNATGQVASLRTQSVGDYDVTYTYTYDANGNITSVSDGTYTTLYSYDAKNQLIRETNGRANKVWVWAYDTAGNIVFRNEVDGIVLPQFSPSDRIAYSYGDSQWGDLLTSYNGQAITYDEIGNPLSDGTWTYTWEHGRELASMTSGTTTWTNTYDANGLRTKRTDGTNTYIYYYTGDKLTYMTENGVETWYYYDASGTPYGIYYGVEYYFYATNLQGDIMAILDRFGVTKVEYSYDAWGNVLSTTGTMSSTLGAANALRYRGYVYDRETGLYYLQSRYYNPEWGRFLNADTYTSTGQGVLGNNMFAYCRNNPVRRIDISGAADCDFAEKNLDQTDDPDELMGGPKMGGGGGAAGTAGSFTSGSSHSSGSKSNAKSFYNILKSVLKGYRPTERTLPDSQQKHHIFPHNNSKYSSNYNKTAKKYSFNLNGTKNLIDIQGHLGRHTNGYHDMATKYMGALDLYAAGNRAVFLEGVHFFAEYLRENPSVLYGRYGG